MLIALLAVLGVDLVVIVGVAAVLVSRRAWVSHQPGAFKGAIRVTGGDVPGFRPKWKRGFGRWVGEVLVWAKAPMLFRNELVADGPRLEFAARADKRERALGPFAGSAGAGSCGRHGRSGAGATAI